MDRKQKKIFLALCLVFLATVIAYYFVEKESYEAGKTKLGKEILVARDIGGGLPYSLVMWCGNSSFLIYGDEFGTEWIDFNGNKATISTDNADYPRGCTPDGKWVLYEDRNSGRAYKDKHGRIPENIVDEGPGWHGLVMDVYRYEIATGTRQKFAVVRDDSGSLVSPDGLKVLLGNRHDSVIDMPEPKWETVWFTNEWLADTRWFADSSGIATMIWWGNGHVFGVEFFGKEGWAKEYSLEKIDLKQKSGNGVSFRAVDKDNRLYFTAVESYRVDNRVRNRFHFYRCEIKNKDLVCEAMGEYDERENTIVSSEFLANGDFIFNRTGEDNCIRRLKHGRSDVECIADARYGNDTYEYIHLIAVSPDGKRMAFRREKIPPKQGNRFYAYQYDLFVKELHND